MSVGGPAGSSLVAFGACVGPTITFARRNQPQSRWTVLHADKVADGQHRRWHALVGGCCPLIVSSDHSAMLRATAGRSVVQAFHGRAECRPRISPRSAASRPGRYSQRCATCSPATDAIFSRGERSGEVDGRRPADRLVGVVAVEDDGLVATVADGQDVDRVSLPRGANTPPLGD